MTVSLLFQGLPFHIFTFIRNLLADKETEAKS